MFVSLGAPQLEHVYRTLMFIATEPAKGKKTEQDVIDENWKVFAKRDVKDVKGEKLHYYKDWNTPNSTVADLLTKKDGDCLAWTKLWIDVLAANNITEKDNYVVLSSTYGGMFLVNDWTFKGNGTSGNKDAPYINTFADNKTTDFYQQNATTKNWEFVWGDKVEVADVAGVPGQNTANPRSIFGGHVVAIVKGKVYDASYGLIFDVLAKWDAASVAGNAAFEDRGNAPNHDYAMHFKKAVEGKASTYKSLSYTYLKAQLADKREFAPPPRG